MNISENPYRENNLHFCKCPQCNIIREISLNTFYAMNKKVKPISKICLKCANFNRRINKEYKLECSDCKKIINVCPSQMCTWRKTNNYHCRECNNKRLSISGLKYRKQKGCISWNKGKGKKTKEDIRIYKLNWKYKNIEKTRECARNYYRNNIEKCRENLKLSRHNRKAQSYITKEIYYTLLLSTDSCNICKTSLLDKKFEIDHIHPIKLGGTNDIENLQLLCVSCNRRKSCKPLKQFLEDLKLITV